MKFGKELASQMVPEWQEAYMDYNNLKKLLKDILRFRQQNVLSSSSPMARTGSLKRRLNRAFSGLANRDNILKGGSPRKNEEEVILVGSVQHEGSENYQTMFLRSSDAGGQFELVFFKALDDEFNKVVRFYKEKVQEVKGAAEELSKQMDALIALRTAVDKLVVQRFASDINAESSSGFPGPATVVASVNGVKPVSTLRKCIMSSKSDVSCSREELRKVEEQLRRAFVEFYQQLRILKSYCFLNMLAFSKIVKKYDKITSRNASKSYLEMVDNSYLGSSEEVNKLIERLEAAFVKHFANGNRKKGMKSLKPKHKKEKHRTTFFLGLFTGCSIALVSGIIVSIHAGNLLDHPGRGQYMDTIFPLYSLFGYIFLHMLMYGANTYFWKRFSVNYPFIFGFKPGTELGFREIFLVASGLSVLALAATLANLDMEMDQRTARFQTLTELVPLGLIAVVLLITFCPFNIIYRSSRFFLIQCAWRCILAPLYKVTMADFFLADQFTSQIQAIRCIQFYICYYIWGDFTTRSTTFLKSNTYEIFYIVIAVIPFWSRVLQCLRRLFEEKDISQGFNSLKYFSTVAALVLRTIYYLRRGSFWRIMAASSSGFTTLFNTYWDIVIDWGLLQRNSKNPLLRDKLLVPNKAVYFIAILVLDIQDTPFLHRKAMVALVASLEILRRGIWNFFRLENEHLNNVGRYRAFKHVPLPFNYADEKIL
ncbi:hypothetical protein F511_25372 [Dorcoceras hygrometricum]|uniref:Uncharacterized protein n=1 Tax=Dorcoceras hygrometricum TaxID=472368 RepID=A0A2Z7AAH9_9LAMI|nr:hypothetical protein F511_25372 [Dorcoceras hygrometricum]